MGVVHERWPGALLVGSPIASETPTATTAATASAPSDPVATLVEPVTPGVIVPAATVRLLEHAERVGGILVRSTRGTTAATSTMTIGTGRGTIVVVIAIAVRTFPMFWLVLFHLGRTGSVTERSSR